jgi:DNA-binding transcriptional MocR family regulator
MAQPCKVRGRHLDIHDDNQGCVAVINEYNPDSFSVNVWIVTMTPWSPDLSGRTGPRYIAIADVLAADIEAGRLGAGDQLPTHRALADVLGVTVGTITRAYAEAARRGLVGGEVGRGTYVRGAPDRGNSLFALSRRAEHRPNTPLIADMRHNFAPRLAQDDSISRALAAIAAENIEALLAYQTHEGMPEHRAAGAEWVALGGVAVEPDRVLVTCGGQHGTAVAFNTLLEPGDTLLTEALTYPGVRTLARMLRLRIQGVAMDSEGLIPEAFEAACRQGSPRALYCMPTMQNPTGTVMPVERRRIIAGIAERYGVAIIEDDVYGYLIDNTPPPLSNFAPTQGYYLTSLSKCIAPGLRIGFLVVPAAQTDRFLPAMQATVWMAAPIMAEIARRLIADGTAQRLAEARRQEARARQNLARHALGALGWRAHPVGLHGWLRLSDPWRADDFAMAAAAKGAPVTPIGAFAVTRTKEQAVRICLGAASDRTCLARALGELAGILAAAPEPYLSVV